MVLQTNRDRIGRILETLAGFNETPGQGITRPTFSVMYCKAQDYLLAEMEAIGMQVRVTAHGNVRARLAGQLHDAPVVMTGSHIDSVAHGGRFDGVAGVVAALEAVRVIASAGLALMHPVEVVIFAEEEGARFGSLLTGSKAAIGELAYQDLVQLRDSAGVSYVDGVRQLGVDPMRVAAEVLQPKEVKAMLELHIEQSVVLEQAGIPIGLVENIAGARQSWVELVGVANHAGATPMSSRFDALAGAAETIGQIEAIANRHVKAGAGTVATVGRIECEPGVANVIPGRATFTVDVRDVDVEQLQRTAKEIQEVVRATADRRNLQCTIEERSQTPTIALSQKIAEMLERTSRELGISCIRVNSGAVHDAAILAQIADAGMIFVPSKNGRSHCPEEYTDIDDVKRGADILLQTLVQLAS